jgi:hypothetical protein
LTDFTPLCPQYKKEPREGVQSFFLARKLLARNTLLGKSTQKKMRKIKKEFKEETENNEYPSTDIYNETRLKEESILRNSSLSHPNIPMKEKKREIKEMIKGIGNPFEDIQKFDRNPSMKMDPEELKNRENAKKLEFAHKFNSKALNLLPKKESIEDRISKVLQHR